MLKTPRDRSIFHGTIHTHKPVPHFCICINNLYHPLHACNSWDGSQHACVGAFNACMCSLFMPLASRVKTEVLDVNINSYLDTAMHRTKGIYKKKNYNSSWLMFLHGELVRDFPAGLDRLVLGIGATLSIRAFLDDCSCLCASAFITMRIRSVTALEKETPKVKTSSRIA